MGAVVNLARTDADELLERYLAVRARTEQLAGPLSPEDQTVQSMPDVSPTKWHRAHTTWFFEAFVLPGAVPGYRPYHPDYAYLFNSYYEAAGPRHPRAARGVVTRPGAAEVGEYRRAVDRAMGDVLAGPPLEARTAFLVELGLHHEQQHQELLLMDIKHVLSCNPLAPAYLSLPPSPAGSATALAWLEHPGGEVAIGHSGEGFGFDNEFPRHTVYLQPFSLASRTVTCGEWLAFIDDGGYRRPELWLSEGWATVQEQGWEAPLYWSRREGTWWVFTLLGQRPVREDEPVCHVSYYEADAFARWAGARLPSEAEWEVAAATWAEPTAGASGASDAAVDAAVDAAIDPSWLHPAPASTAIFAGDVWQWTASAYGPYPGFRPAAGAVGEYNGKFMVNQYVLRGGCCATPPGHARITYRNFFPAQARWPFTGVRLARDS